MHGTPFTFPPNVIGGSTHIPQYIQDYAKTLKNGKKVSSSSLPFLYFIY